MLTHSMRRGVIVQQLLFSWQSAWFDIQKTLVGEPLYSEKYRRMLHLEFYLHSPKLTFGGDGYADRMALFSKLSRRVFEVTPPTILPCKQPVSASWIAVFYAIWCLAQQNKRQYSCTILYKHVSNDKQRVVQR